MQTFTPNPEHYILQKVPPGGSTCPQCALFDPEKWHCDGYPSGTWFDQCLYPENLDKVWVLRPEIANQ